MSRTHYCSWLGPLGGAQAADCWLARAPLASVGFPPPLGGRGAVLGALACEVSRAGRRYDGTDGATAMWASQADHVMALPPMEAARRVAAVRVYLLQPAPAWHALPFHLAHIAVRALCLIRSRVVDQPTTRKNVPEPSPCSRGAGRDEAK